MTDINESFESMFDGVTDDHDPHVKITVSLLIRLFEFFAENEVDDEHIHMAAELIEELGAEGDVLTMDEYAMIVGESEITDEELDFLDDELPYSDE